MWTDFQNSFTIRFSRKLLFCRVFHLTLTTLLHYLVKPENHNCRQFQWILACETSDGDDADMTCFRVLSSHLSACVCVYMYVWVCECYLHCDLCGGICCWKDFMPMFDWGGRWLSFFSGKCLSRFRGTFLWPHPQADCTANSRTCCSATSKADVGSSAICTWQLRWTGRVNVDVVANRTRSCYYTTRYLSTFFILLFSNSNFVGLMVAVWFISMICFG